MSNDEEDSSEHESESESESEDEMNYRVRRAYAPPTVRLALVSKFKGHRNTRTMIKQANFWGSSYILSGTLNYEIAGDMSFKSLGRLPQHYYKSTANLLLRFVFCIFKCRVHNIAAEI